ncbi:unnamed protein product [Knipowitschia caucasica]
MSSPASNEERNRLRLQAWEQRNHESSQVKKQNFFDGHLFGQPYKTNKEDELSSRIQRMLGSYEDDSSAEPFSIPSSLTFPLSNRTPPVSESSSHLQVCYGYQGLKGTCAKSSSTPYSPDRRCEGDSFFRPSLQKSAARDDRDRPLYHTPSEDANANANMQSSPHNRTMAMSHSQAFHLPLSNKPPAMTQKPTAYVRPMDGQDLIWTESPELKPPSGPQTSLQELSRDKSVRGNANVSPSFLASKTSELQCVEEILREMTCSWPPLLSDIHSPRPHCAPKPQCSVKEISPLKQENVQAASIESSHSHPGLTVLSTETPSRAVDSVCSSDVESSKSASESECGADDPPVTAPIKHAAALGDWQLDKITDFRQQNYRSKTQWPNVQSPILSPVTDVPKQATVCIFSPLRDSPKRPPSNQNAINVTTPQESGSSPREVVNPSEPVRTENHKNRNVSVHYELTFAKQDVEPKPKDKTERKRHKHGKNNAVFESTMTVDHLKEDRLESPAVIFSPVRDSSNLLPLNQNAINVTSSQESGLSSREVVNPSEPVRTENHQNRNLSVHYERTFAKQDVEPKPKDKTERKRHKHGKNHAVFESTMTVDHLKKDRLESPAVIFSPVRDSPNPLPLNKNAINVTSSQESGLSSREVVNSSELGRTENHQNRNLSVNFEWTSTKQEEKMKDEPKAERKRRKHGKNRVVFESTKSVDHSKKDGLESPVAIFSPLRDPPNGLPSNQNSIKETSPQEFGPLSREVLNLSEPVQTENNPNGNVRVNFERTLANQEEDSTPKYEPKAKTDRKRRKHRKNRVDQHKKDRLEAPVVQPAVSPVCRYGSSKAEDGHKMVARLSSQTDTCVDSASLVPPWEKLSLVVKINLNLLPKVPRASGCHKRNIIQHCAKDEKPHKVSHSKTNVKEESGPKKKQKLQDPSPTPQTSQQEHSTTSDAKANKAKKNAEPHTSTLRESKKSKKCKTHKQHSSTAPESNKETKKCQNDSDQPQEKSGKTMQETTAQKPRQESSRNKPQPKCEKRKLPVKHYIKEAKRLKHKADAEMDKLHKTFHYLQAALFFIESGIAMEREPHTSLSSYTMFGETVELLKFVLRLTNSKDASPSENDLISLCLRCQALLQMAMFHLKQKPALAFSKTLIDHFNNSKSAADSIKGKTSAQSPHGAGASGSIVVPQDVGQVALTYVNITTLFLTAHDLWEQADEFVTKGSGLTVELDRTMGALSLSSTMSSMVSYVRQGLHRLQTSNPKP